MVWSVLKDWERRFMKSFKAGFKLYCESKMGIVGLGIVGFFVAMAALAPVIAPYSPDFIAPTVDIFIPYEYPMKVKENGESELSVFSTTPGKLGANGISWIAVYNSKKIVLYAVADPIKGTIGQNESQNQTGQIRRISPWEAAWWVKPRVIEIYPSSYNLKEPFTRPIYLPGCLNADYTLPGDADSSLNGVLVFGAGDELVFYDVANQKVVSKINIGFVPKYVAADPLGAGETSKPTVFSEQTTLFGQKIRIPPRRFVVCASDNRLAAFRIFYSYSVINKTTQVWIEKFLDVQESSSLLFSPVVYYNPYYDWKNAIIVGLNNKTTLFYTFDEQLTFDKTNYTLLPPVKFYEKYELLAPPGFKRTTDECPQYYLLVKTSEGLRIMVYDVLERKPLSVLDLGNYNLATQPDVIDTANGDAILFAISNGNEHKIVRCDYYFETVTAKFNFTLSAIAEIPHKPVYSFVSPPTAQLFVLCDNNIVYVSDIIVENFNARDLYTANYLTKRLDKVSDIDSVQYVGSLLGSKYSIQIASAQTYAIYYSSKKEEIVLFKCRGDNIAPLPPGKYPSGNTYLLGTDHEGHDILTHLMYGARIALLIGILAAVTETLLGTILGIAAGYYGGWVDTILMRIVDVMLTLPGLPIILIMTSVLGPNIINIILVLSLLGWAGIARVIRAQTLSLKARPFVDAARVAGASNIRIILRHIMPNVLPFTFLYMTIGVSGVILSEAALSFLGLGDPKSITWGQMLSTLQSTGNTMHAWWWLLPPGLSITFVSLGFYLIGRAFDEIVNPRLRKR